ncbi:hypothetical protein [Petroclostridium sp. X23]|uniref:hypothetical protein n=1 Tax=Petroclostridium sp. X23 TaxID=3045146 RepID=UPI0024ADD20F|nr:hypothetical protein [Petroclostridium sp. X23]WHH59215.1 hypothetical protein QKW49_00140 [Petroclostridium sp. X23]
MRLSQVREILNAQVLTGDEYLDMEVKSACGCDLMSDVLAFVKDQGLLLTGLVNPQVVRTAEMMDIRVIIFVRGKAPEGEMLKLAKDKEMVLFTTAYPLYTACGLLYSAGLRG